MTNEELVQKYYCGDSEALEQLCEQLSKFVHSLAYDTAEIFNGADKEELFNVGILKLMELLNTKSYDPSRAKLSTYIYPHIQGTMLYECYNESNPYDNEQIVSDFHVLYEAMNGKTLREMDEVIYPVCTLCRDHEEAEFVEGVKIGVVLT